MVACRSGPQECSLEIFVPRNVSLVCKMENSKKINWNYCISWWGGRERYGRWAASSPGGKEDRQGTPRAVRGAFTNLRLISFSPSAFPTGDSWVSVDMSILLALRNQNQEVRRLPVRGPLTAPTFLLSFLGHNTLDSLDVVLTLRQ